MKFSKNILILAAVVLGIIFFLFQRSKAPEVSSSIQEELAEENLVMLPYQISVSVNHSTSPQVPKGWPVLIEGILNLPQGIETPETVLKAKTNWNEFVHLEIRNETGAEQNWSVTKSPWAVPQDAELKIGALHPASAIWTLSSEKSALLKPGKYTLQVFLKDSSGKVQGKSAPAKIEILAGEESVENSERERTLLQAQYFQLQGEDAKAFSVLGKFLSANPNDVEALTFHANLLEKTGQPAEALKVIQQISDQIPDHQPLPRHLAKRRHRLLLESLKETK